MGEWVKDLLERRHINFASMARAMEIDPKSTASYWTSKVISDEVLMRMTNALGWDLIGMVRNEQARRMSPQALPGDAIGESLMSEPMPAYQRRPASASDSGLVLMVNLDDYDEPDQLRILRTLQQVPKRGRSKATGS